MIQILNDQIFVLSTASTTYAFRTLPTGQLEHLTYGGLMKIDESTASMLGERMAFVPGNTISYTQDFPELTMENVRLEASFYGKGDIREPLADIVYADGSFTSDFIFDHYTLTDGPAVFEELPGATSSEESQIQTLCVTLKEKKEAVYLDLYYTVFPETNVITRRSVLRNEGETVTVRRLLSMQMDLTGTNWNLTSFTGAWAREMNKQRALVKAGKLVVSSYTGTSSNRANPFVMVHPETTTENQGKVYGFNLVYSGNHYEALEAGSFGKTRFVSGINPQSFSWQLAQGERLVSPEAVLSFSDEGFNGLSHNLHAFVREHVVRGTWKKKERPILLNSWEAYYFDFNESKLLKLAETAKNVGIELFVMDDGWFGKRDDDTTSLGDWTENKKKLPGGLSGLAKKINALGLSFGIWVEPEMVNVDSELYRAHPEWVLEIPEKSHSEGRNQRVLDLGNPLVQQYVIDEMSRVFSSANVAYVKWDMNRIYSDAFSQALPAGQQGEVVHRCQLGLYRCMKELTERFPDVLFEGCASGGNRFDLGILCYFPQIWASDNTDAVCRAEIQNGYGYGYPQSVIGAHVSSCPNHQTLRVTPLETRFAVASFGVLGYECNLADMKKEDLEAVKHQIELYKQWRSVLQFGTWIRGESFGDGGNVSNLREEKGNVQEWYAVSEDGTKEVIVLLQRFAIPNNHSRRLRARGLDPEKTYRFTNRALKYNVKGFGDLVNTVAPIHVKQDSLIHNVVAKLVKMDGETEDYLMGGDVLMRGGVNLKQPYGGTGYNDQVRYFPDFSARMYFVEEK